LLSDEAQIANRRDAELNVIRAETHTAKERAAALLDELLKARSNN
jgi:mediator of RNA polymerase II transcription subunit 22